jgi:transcriptional regulator with XRE-family HTH domain
MEKIVITRSRDVRKGKKLTLDDVAQRSDPPTTPQTIGRLETGMRTVSIGWLNRIAAALEVDAADLVEHPQQEDLPVVATLSPTGAAAPRRTTRIIPPRTKAGQVAVQVTSGVGDYRAGDELWCEQLPPEEFGRALNRDILVPRPAGRFLFGRLIGREGDKLHLLPPGAGTRQSVVSDPPWLALVVRLVRNL